LISLVEGEDVVAVFKCSAVIMSCAAGVPPVQDHNVQTTPETDSVAQGLASLEQRLSVELKVCMPISYSSRFYIIMLLDIRHPLDFVRVFLFVIINRCIGVNSRGERGHA